jgi:hypothetical protein
MRLEEDGKRIQNQSQLDEQEFSRSSKALQARTQSLSEADRKV